MCWSEKEANRRESEKIEMVNMFLSVSASLPTLLCTLAAVSHCFCWLVYWRRLVFTQVKVGPFKHPSNCYLSWYKPGSVIFFHFSQTHLMIFGCCLLTCSTYCSYCVERVWLKSIAVLQNGNSAIVMGQRGVEMIEVQFFSIPLRLTEHQSSKGDVWYK